MMRLLLLPLHRSQLSPAALTAASRRPAKAISHRPTRPNSTVELGLPVNVRIGPTGTLRFGVMRCYDLVGRRLRSSASARQSYERCLDCVGLYSMNA